MLKLPQLGFPTDMSVFRVEYRMLKFITDIGPFLTEDGNWCENPRKKWYCELTFPYVMGLIMGY
jgi:hypothetical protein